VDLSIERVRPTLGLEPIGLSPAQIGGYTRLHLLCFTPYLEFSN
jgi:hypothetical protein